MNNIKKPSLILKPSQWLNIGWFIVGIAGSFLVIPPLIAIYKYVEIYYWQYECYFDEKYPFIIERKGVFSVTRNKILLSRVKNIKMESPFLLRLVNLANLYVLSSDPYTHQIKLHAIPNALTLWHYLEDLAALERKRKGIKELDIYQL